MRRLFLLGIITITIGFTQLALSQETAFNRVSSTLSGGSGLFTTQSINTLAPGRLEVGLGLSYEDGNHKTLGDLTIPKLSSTVTVGLSPNIEASAQIPYFLNLKVGNDTESSIGEINLSVKWRLMEASTDLNFPGFAFHLTAFLPTGGDKSKGTAKLESWGAQLLLVSSAEAEVGLPDMHVLVGFYADGGVYIQDTGETTEDNTGILDLGILVPLSEAKEIQLIIEANARVKQELLLERQYAALMGGIRYIKRHIALNAGWQHRINQSPLEDSDRLIFYGSYFF